MLTAERHRLIMDLLSQKEVVKLQSIVQKTDSSESTIRRDLALLEEQGLLKRIHGGATLPYSKFDEPNMQEKVSKNSDEKRVIAQLAASLIRDGDCIYLDAGTTVAEMLPFLVDKKIVIVTNGLMHIELLTAANITTYLLGGRIKANTKAIVGSVAQDNLRKYRFDKCFLGMNGVDLELGFTTPDPEEGVLKQIAIELAEEAFVLADESKFTETFFSKVCDVDHATIITDKMDEELLKKFRQKTDMKVVKS
ncbi:MAG: DeoR/GlpR family DNA-binding transcription regulator [Bacillus sp. (in: firmicutes)]